jgi:TolB protein
MKMWSYYWLVLGFLFFTGCQSEEISPPPTLTATVSSNPTSEPTNQVLTTPTTISNWWEYEETLAYWVLGNGGFIYITGEDFNEPILISEDYPWTGSPIWSPDGEMIAFMSFFLSYNNLYLFDIYTNQTHQITDYEEGAIWGIKWSPGGSMIAFCKDYGIHIYDLTNNEISTPVTFSSFGISGIMWLPDESGIVFVSGQDDLWDFYLYSFRNEELTKLFHTSQPIGWSALSPDGEWIAFVSDRPNNDGSDIHIFNIQSRSIVRLTDSPAYKSWLRWSPDGSKIAFQLRWLDEHFDIYIIDPDGENLTQLTDFAGDEVHPEWSNLGNKIAFEFNILSPEDERDAGKREMNPQGIWIYDFSSVSFVYLDGTEGGYLPTWRP